MRRILLLSFLSSLSACSGSDDPTAGGDPQIGAAGLGDGGSTVGGDVPGDGSGTAGASSTGGSSNGAGGASSTAGTCAGDECAGAGGVANGGNSSTAGTGTGGDPGTSNPNTECELLWESGFEDGFPAAEWDAFDNGSWSPSGTMPGGRVSAWTIVDSASGEPVHSGDSAYKGWIEGTDGSSHRPYPSVSLGTEGFETPVINTFWVYQEADYGSLNPSDWIHFGTWGNCVQGAGGQCDSGNFALHTMSLVNRRLEFAHTDPFTGEYIGPEPQPDFPLDQWVKFTVYLHYQGATGTVVVWQDGVPMLQASVPALGEFPGTELVYIHWGLYAAGSVGSAAQYNDDIQVWELPAPLDDFQTEPVCD